MQYWVGETFVGGGFGNMSDKKKPYFKIKENGCEFIVEVEDVLNSGILYTGVEVVFLTEAEYKQIIEKENIMSKQVEIFEKENQGPFSIIDDNQDGCKECECCKKQSECYRTIAMNDIEYDLCPKCLYAINYGE